MARSNKTFDTVRPVTTNKGNTEYSTWESDDEEGGGEKRRDGGPKRTTTKLTQDETKRRMNDENKLGRYHSRSKSKEAPKARHGDDGDDDFKAENEAIKITRAELEKLRRRIDQARSEAGYSISRPSSRASSRHTSRRSIAAASDSASELGDDSGLLTGVMDGLGGTDAIDALGEIFSLDGEKPPIWTEDELDDPSTKNLNAAALGRESALVPQKVIQKYEQARRDYHAAVLAKKKKKSAARYAKDGDLTPKISAVQGLAAQFKNAMQFGGERKVRKQMDYKNHYTKAARIAHAKNAAPKAGFFASIHNAMFGCCAGRGAR